jgi:hypothetical protein
MKRRIEKVHSSQRIGSTVDPDALYEFLHVRLEGGEDAVVIQMVSASQPAIALPARIPIKDLKDVEEALLVFMEGVRKKAGDVTSLERAFFTLGVPSMSRAEEEHAVFRDDPSGPKSGARPPTTTSEILISSGPRKGYYDPNKAAAASAAATGAGAVAGSRGPQLEEPPPKVIAFTLAHPPTVEDLIKELQADMKRLVVVARKEMAAKVQAYLDGVMAGNQELTKRPGEFEAVVVPRKGGKATLKHKMGAALAHGIVEIVANPTKVLWIPSESAT